MLTHLTINNYVLIESLDIDLQPGFSVMTGETGAGKSIILGALGLLMGQRAESGCIMPGAAKCTVEGIFNIEGYDMQAIFEENELDYEPAECILRREVAANGKSRAFVNDSPVNVTVLRQIATRLLDIHSQHSNMLLSQPAFQLSILDNIADNRALLDQYRTAYQDYRESSRELEENRLAIEKMRGEQDYIQFQLEQLTSLQLLPDEDKELESLQSKLSNVTELKETLWIVENELNGDENSILDRLTTVAQRLEDAESTLKDVEGCAARVRSALIDLKDIAQSISNTADTLNDDPAELACVNERLDIIYTLLRKHNVRDVNQLLEIQHSYERQLNEIEHNDETLEALSQRVAATHDAAVAIATKLSSRRKKAAEHFKNELLTAALPLGLKNIAFDANISSTGLTASGTDNVEFLMAFNKNQRPMPVKDTASGGEISRVMLCIKAIIARHMRLPSIIFDEVDTGVSGDVANMIGEMMAGIADTIQVIAITHLPQVAAHGAHHLRVFKADNDNETLTHVEPLNEQEHILEIARMLSGKDLNQAAIENAKSLIKNNLK